MKFLTSPPALHMCFNAHFFKQLCVCVCRTCPGGGALWPTVLWWAVVGFYSTVAVEEKSTVQISSSGKTHHCVKPVPRALITAMRAGRKIKPGEDGGERRTVSTPCSPGFILTQSLDPAFLPALTAVIGAQGTGVCHIKVVNISTKRGTK